MREPVQKQSTNTTYNRLVKGDKILLATHNKYKIEEFKFHLGDYFDLVLADDIEIPESEEIGSTFREISILKARIASMTSGLPALADDSGICVKILDGDPGIYSARWGGENRDQDQAMKRLLSEIDARGTSADRSADVHCGLTLYYPDKMFHYVESSISGCISKKIMTNGKGYGYDPVFILDGCTETFNYLPDPVRWYHSHRGLACRQMIDIIENVVGSTLERD